LPELFYKRNKNKCLLHFFVLEIKIVDFFVIFSCTVTYDGYQIFTDAAAKSKKIPSGLRVWAGIPVSDKNTLIF